MKKILLFIITLTFSISIFAGAAEKWEYDIEPIPDPAQRKVLVTGHKVDQYGDAVNDSKYKTTIDPKTIANKQKMGAVGMAKLLKKANWASLGVEALQQLLEAVDWVIDPQAQSIWRNKKTDANNNYVCYYTKNQNGKTYQVFYVNGYGTEFSCPLEAAKDLIKNYNNGQTYIKPDSGTFIKWVNDINDTALPVKFIARYTRKSDDSIVELTHSLSYNLKETQVEKEYLTPDALADYANKTHPDYTNPQLAPKLDPKYKPEIIPNLWKPHNEWEKTNSPTVQEVNKQLDQANPSSDSTDVDPKTDPEGNPNGFSLPSFCSWATPVCDFFKWLKTDPELEDLELPEHELEKQEIKKDKVSIRARSCPADIQFDVQGLPFGIQINRGYQMQPICDTLEPLKYVFHLITVCLCAFMLLRI